MRFRTSRRIFRRASRYALRVSRSVVVNLSLSRRNAASESKRKAVVRCSWLVSLLLFLDKLWPNRSSGLATCEPLQTYHYTRIGCGRVSQRAALIGTAPTHKAMGHVFFTTCIIYWSYYYLSGAIKMRPQNFHFLRSHNNQIAKIAFFEVTILNQFILLGNISNDLQG